MSEAPGAAETPALSAEEQAFEDNFSAFLGHSFDGPDDEEDKQTLGGDTGGEESSSAPAAGDTPSSDAPANADIPAATGEQTGEQPDPEVDPADLAAMLGLTEVPAAPADPAPAPAAAPNSQENPPEDEPFTPFQPTFKLRPEMAAALFESEVPAEREAALVGLLASFGNAICQVVDQRYREFHAPRTVALTQRQMSEQSATQAVFSHFYGVNKDLLPYKNVVVQAMKVYAAKNPGATYSEELATNVAKLARQALKASGINLAPAAAAPPAPARAAPSKAPGSAFEAGAARPASPLGSTDSGPADLVDQLSKW